MLLQYNKYKGSKYAAFSVVYGTYIMMMIFLAAILKLFLQ